LEDALHEPRKYLFIVRERTLDDETLLLHNNLDLVYEGLEAGFNSRRLGIGVRQTTPGVIVNDQLICDKL
jgi:hypothetical protein